MLFEMNFRQPRTSLNRPTRESPLPLISLLVGFITLLAFSVFFAGCAPQKAILDYALATPFIPLNVLPASPQSIPSPFPTGTLTCQNNLTFINDITIPDGTTVIPGSVIDKRWEVANSGSCNWDARYRLRLIAGSLLGAPAPEQALFPARSGTHAIIRVVFHAPLDPGRYRSAWQAFDPEDLPFGDPVFIEIEVITPTPGP